jgi:hypothetical protein
METARKGTSKGQDAINSRLAHHERYCRLGEGRTLEVDWMNFLCFPEPHRMHCGNTTSSGEGSTRYRQVLTRPNRPLTGQNRPQLGPTGLN